MFLKQFHQVQICKHFAYTADDRALYKTFCSHYETLKHIHRCYKFLLEKNMCVLFEVSSVKYTDLLPDVFSFISLSVSPIIKPLLLCVYAVRVGSIWGLDMFCCKKKKTLPCPSYVPVRVVQVYSVRALLSQAFSSWFQTFVELRANRRSFR